MENLFPDIIFLQMSEIIKVHNKFMYSLMKISNKTASYKSLICIH